MREWISLLVNAKIGIMSLRLEIIIFVVELKHFVGSTSAITTCLGVITAIEPRSHSIFKLIQFFPYHCISFR